MPNAKSIEKSHQNWEELIALTEERLGDAKVKVEELTKALAAFRARQKAGDKFPSTQN